MKYSLWALVLLITMMVGSVETATGNETGTSPMGKAATRVEKATFAGGCFWCMESPFDKLQGVVSVTVGYTGGSVKNPTYEQVSSGGTGHAESVQIVFDPSKIGYEKLLDVFWHNIDPTVADRQFCDAGHQYRSAIFYHTQEQLRLAQQSKATVEKTLKQHGGNRDYLREGILSRRKNTISTTTKKILSDTSSIATGAVATGGSRSYGGTPPDIDHRCKENL